VPADKLRLLICHDCESIEELPPYEGPTGNDDTLNYRVGQHRFPNGEEHIGVLATVPAANWEKPDQRHEIIRRITEAKKPGDSEGLGSPYYNVKATFQEDAMTCWKKHNRTQNCDEWRGDHKRLYPDTLSDRKEAGITTRRPNTWLCDFCPVTSIYSQRRNEARGDYD